MAQLRHAAAALGIGACGGLAFHALHLPLPFMLGAMAATTAAALAGVRLALPRSLRTGLVPVLGVLFGSLIDVAALPEPRDLLVIVPVVLATLAVTVGLGTLFFRRAGLDPASALFAAVPGNFSQIVIVAEEAGADVRRVSLVHAARLLITIPAISVGLQLWLGVDTFGAPAAGGALPGPVDVAVLVACGLAGWGAATLVRLPAPALFGPLVLSAAAHAAGWVEGAPPGWLVAAAQILLGAFAGARFSGAGVRAMAGLVAASAAWSLCMLAIAGACAAAAAPLIGQPLVPTFVALAPGGFPEISMVAIAAGIDLGLVSAVTFIRMCLVLLLVPLAARLRR